MQYEYRTSGVCSRKILFEINDGIVSKIRFEGGCSGNTQGVARLADGMPVDRVIALLKDIHCGPRPTSCPDQLARALLDAKQK